MADTPTARTASLVLGDGIRTELAERLGVDVDDVPTAFTLTAGQPEEVEGFATAARPKVRDLLTVSPAFHSLPADERREIAHDTVKVL